MPGRVTAHVVEAGRLLRFPVPAPRLAAE